MAKDSGDGVVYTETIIYSPPEQYAADAPYQLAIVDVEERGRQTVRVVGERAHIGDRVSFVEERNGVAYYQKAKEQAGSDR
jgi:uncharacterized OB-fold protein